MSRLNILSFRILIILPALFLILSSTHLSYIDKSAFDTVMYILLRLPIVYYLGLSSLALAFIIGSLKQCIRVHDAIFLVFIFVAYLELPRLMYSNGFQMEYFHQAQVFHVVNYGTVTDKFYPFPQSDINHAIFSTALTEVSGVDKLFMVGHIIPVLLRLSLVLILFIIAMDIKGSLSKLFIIIIPLYILICDTEFTYTNHYIYVLPVYAMTIVTLLWSSKNNKFKPIVLLLSTSLIFAHIYFATLTMIVLIIFLIFNYIVKADQSLQSTIVITSIIFLLWHGYTSEWSIHAFYRELRRSLSIAYQRFLAFHINPAGYIIRSYGRFGGIPIKIEYATLLWAKWLTIAVFNILIIMYIGINVARLAKKIGAKKSLLMYIRTPIFWLWIVSGVFLIIYGFTVTAHPQRVLEAFIIPTAGILAYAANLSEECEKNNVTILKSRSYHSAILVALLIFSVVSIPVKVIWYWGTSLTYIGFTEKYLWSIKFSIKGITSKNSSIYFIGDNPYWFYNDIYSNLSINTIGINAPLNNISYWIHNIKELFMTNHKSKILLVDLTSGILPMNAKYEIKIYLNSISKVIAQEVSNNIDFIYMNSRRTYLTYWHN